VNYVLDTHILLWWTLAPERLSKRQKKILDGLTPECPGLLSDISLWEIATAYSLGRIELQTSLEDYLTAAAAQPLIVRQPISPAVAAEVAALPTHFPRDPGDRIIVATTRILDATLLTSDSRIALSRLVRTVH
jgi:PIN domain nuclease of toxin-antitoxin system